MLDSARASSKLKGIKNIKNDVDKDDRDWTEVKSRARANIVEITSIAADVAGRKIAKIETAKAA